MDTVASLSLEDGILEITDCSVGSYLSKLNTYDKYKIRVNMSAKSNISRSEKEAFVDLGLNSYLGISGLKVELDGVTYLKFKFENEVLGSLITLK